MEWEKRFEEVIWERRSCRTYDDRDIEEEKLLKLKTFLNEQNLKAQGMGMRFAITKEEAHEKIGTYGVITGAKIYIVEIVHSSIAHIEELGIAFERIVLFATNLGLGTCWMAGSIDRWAVKNKITLAEREFVAVVSPLGYAKEPRTEERMMRIRVGAAKRKPWEQLFFDGQLGVPLSREKARHFELPLEMVRLAPSASNRQPWRVIFDDKGFHFCILRSRELNSAILPYDLQKGDVGIAMCHFELMAETGKWVFDENIKLEQELTYVKTWVAN